ncbi:MAG: saccharopine dehydrogenase, partial [Pseudomonadota bacterium]|nr:saccharopine dehydrogenase [Pseudomonadota bacterium]
RVVRRSAALFSQKQESYGVNFVYQENGFFKSFISAFLVSTGTIFAGLILYTPLRKLFRPLLPKPGEGPSQSVMDNGFFECLFLVETEDGDKGLFRMYGRGDPGYRVTSKLVCESALTLSKDEESLPGGEGYGGVLTPSTGLGEPLIKRLLSSGISFENLEL